MTSPVSSQLPQLGGGLFLTDGGIETSLIYHDGLDLPLFAAFDLLKDEAGTAALRRYYRPYLELARGAGAGFVFESPTWRASRDWGDRLGYSAQALAAANRRAMALVAELRAQAPATRRGAQRLRRAARRRLRPERLMAAEEAAGLPRRRRSRPWPQAGADMITAMTMTHVGEAVGRGARGRGSGTCRSRSRSPSRPTAGCPRASSWGRRSRRRRRHRRRSGLLHAQLRPPDPFRRRPARGRRLDRRLRGVRANASRCSHAELDAATELDAGDPDELAAAVCRAAPAAAGPGRARRLLRHRPPPRRGDREGLHRGGGMRLWRLTRGLHPGDDGLPA